MLDWQNHGPSFKAGTTGFSIESICEREVSLHSGVDRGGCACTLESVSFDPKTKRITHSFLTPHDEIDGWGFDASEFKPSITTLTDVIKILNSKLSELQDTTKAVKRLLRLAANAQKFETEYQED